MKRGERMDGGWEADGGIVMGLRRWILQRSGGDANAGNGWGGEGGVFGGRFGGGCGVVV